DWSLYSGAVYSATVGNGHRAEIGWENNQRWLEKRSGSFRLSRVWGSSASHADSSLHSLLALLAHVPDEPAHAVGELDDFAVALDVELHFIIARRRVVHRLFEVDQRLDHLARQDEAEQDAQHQSRGRNDNQHPFRAMRKLASFHLIVQHPRPASRLEVGRQLADGVARCLGV